MHLVGFGNDPRLFLGGGPRRGEGVLTHFDADGETELVVPRQGSQSGAGGGQSRETGAELGFEVDLSGGIVPFFECGVDLAGRDVGETRQVKGVSFERLVCAHGGDNDADGGDGAFQDFGLNGHGGIVDVVAYFRMARLTDGIVVGSDGKEGGSRIDRPQIEDLMYRDGEELGEGCGQRSLGVGHQTGCGDRSGKCGHGGGDGVECGALTGNRHCRRSVWCRRFHGKDGRDGISEILSAVPP